MQGRNRHPLLGRSSECGVLDRMMAELRAGRSQALVLRGEAGIGKTALLDYLAAETADCRLVRAAGIESEMELAYAGLHQFCGPVLGGLERLPDPQRNALGVAFGLQTGAPPDRFMVGLAVLGLLADAAEEHPHVCLVDDAQWLDRASAEILAFVARRLLAERVALVFAVRDGVDASLLRQLPELTVSGLPDGAARAFLGAMIHGPPPRPSETAPQPRSRHRAAPDGRQQTASAAHRRAAHRLRAWIVTLCRQLPRSITQRNYARIGPHRRMNTRE